ncbi:DMT family transporter [Limimaricola pyoseonensis]|uniref:EamA domain-containing membrane protein RarD n=1 Tax=Limimaricola pyoseonensis TaxID=521013 RepID=A0A1G7K0V6_9RHOB|nr:EamA family transporter [Limimaricola pyoseonensis]SDF30631.1 EamA domain-containing membrane protein RarD [Limimaricola pyoseonensis]
MTETAAPRAPRLLTPLAATGVGFAAVLLWALLALFTVGSAPVPVLQLNAVSFGLAALVGLVWSAMAGDLRAVWPGWRIAAFGTIGLMGYHALYFGALRLAPPAEAGLIAYLWPLLIVLFSGLLPGETLRAGHVIGGLVAFAGAALIVGARIRGGFEAAALPGYALAFLAAITWASYSVLSRRLGQAPTAGVTSYCLGTALLSLPAHLAFEQTVWPATTLGWASMIGLGLGPVGLAFFVWDVGVKRGDIQLLGVASYAAPLLSTLVLVLAGAATASWTLAAAAGLITLGAALASRAGARARATAVSNAR